MGRTITQTLPLLLGWISNPSNPWFLGPTKVIPPNGISISSVLCLHNTSVCRCVQHADDVCLSHLVVSMRCSLCINCRIPGKLRMASSTWHLVLFFHVFCKRLHLAGRHIFFMGQISQWWLSPLVWMYASHLTYISSLINILMRKTTLFPFLKISTYITTTFSELFWWQTNGQMRVKTITLSNPWQR